MSYNGWTNYVTWLCSVHGLTEDLFGFWEDYKEDHPDFDKTCENDVRKLRDFFEETCNEYIVEEYLRDVPGLLHDVFVSAWGDVDWDELTNSFLDAYVE